MEFEAIIGLEIHVQMNTSTKLFVRVSNDSFGKEPNENVSPFCFGMPGMLPVLNKDAVEKGVKTSLALNCNIPETCKFDRKNYFYPDLTKGYQISQFDEPLALDGYIEVEVQYKNGESKLKKIGITRLHLEDDAGKSTHVKSGSLLDYNRAGAPLMEIVSEPDMRDAAEAVAYAKEIQKIVRYVESSDADMEKGMMRFDASVSIRPVGETKLYPRAEIKNLNSFRALENAINYEIKRQKEQWLETGKPQESATTVGWSDEKSKTFFMRDKEDSHDYRYFPDPDLPPLTLSADFVKKLADELPEMPNVKKARYIEQLELLEDDARILSENKKLADFFDEVVSLSGDAKSTVSFLNTVLMKYLKEDLVEIDEQKVTATMLAELIKLVNDGVISNSVARNEVFEDMYDYGTSPSLIVEEKGLKQVSDAGALEEACKKVIAENPGPVEDIKNGKNKAIGFLIGMVMKEMKGKANPKMVSDIMIKLILN